MNFRNFKDKVNRYFWFSKEEWKNFIIGVIICGFIFSFDKWGDKTPNILIGLTNFAYMIFISFISIFVHHGGQRLAGLIYGFKIEHKLWWYGPYVSLILSFLSLGQIKFFVFSSFEAHLLPVHRLGFFRHGPNIRTIGIIAFMGPVSNILFATFFKSIDLLFFNNNPFLNAVFIFNLLFAAYNFLPVPPLDGSKIFFGSRLTYIFIFSFFISYVILIISAQYYSYILAFLIAVFATTLFYIFFERKWY